MLKLTGLWDSVFANITNYSFYYSAIQDLNELPLSIKEAKNKDVFESKVKMFLIKKKGLSRQNCEFHFY